MAGYLDSRLRVVREDASGAFPLQPGPGPWQLLVMQDMDLHNCQSIDTTCLWYGTNGVQSVVVA